MMESLRSRVESWIRAQTARVEAIAWPPLSPPPLRLPRWRWWPSLEGWGGDGDGRRRREEEQRLNEELEHRRLRLQKLCKLLKTDSIAELQELVCSMVLSECVYKGPATEMLRHINKFQSDFGGHIVSLECVQPSLDHVPHRYVLAEAGDTLFASFIGTKKYKDVIADVNIFQGTLFHDDVADEFIVSDAENNPADSQKNIEEVPEMSKQPKLKKMKNKLRPAAHRGFLARAKGIPALELYKLAQKKNRKLVLCGHSLGGAVAALATLAILRAFACSPLSKDQNKVQVKCITFSQPPVGNAALRDYVHRKGWQQFFRTYCIPEDLVPRILSPAYFHHYNAQAFQASTKLEQAALSIVEDGGYLKKLDMKPTKYNGTERLALGLGPLKTSFWRLSKLVPVEGFLKNIHIFKRLRYELGSLTSTPMASLQQASMIMTEPQSLEIQESFDGVSLTPIPNTMKMTGEPSGGETNRSNEKAWDSKNWGGVPYFPSYVPFGQLYLLGTSSVELLSDAEYSNLTSVRSIITELKERLQSHSMKSYRSRFQKIYDFCMCINTPPFLGMDQLQQFPHLQQCLGLSAAGAVELGNIVEPPSILAATSIVPLGWCGLPGKRNSEPLKVDVIGHGLHLCTLVQAQVNGNWCSTAVESFPSIPSFLKNGSAHENLQRMRILVGAPLKQPPKYPLVEGSLHPVSSPSIIDSICSTIKEEIRHDVEGLNGFNIYCTSDFITVSKEVDVRTRRVRLLGFEGAGKTSLLRAILSQGRQSSDANIESLFLHRDNPETIVGGLCYLDSPGVKVQDLHLEVARFREELLLGSHDLTKKTDLVILVHNLSQNIPQHYESNNHDLQPALSLLLNEAKAFDIPSVLAITNKFSVSGKEQRMLIDTAMEAYQASPNMTEVLNSCPYVISSVPQSWTSIEEHLSTTIAAQSIIACLPFKKRATVKPVEGIVALTQLIHRVLRNREEMAYEEFASKRLSIEFSKEPKSFQRPQVNGNPMTAAAVGASVGAGLGLVMAVVMGAASALRKP